VERHTAARRRYAELHCSAAGGDGGREARHCARRPAHNGADKRRTSPGRDAGRGRGYGQVQASQHDADDGPSQSRPRALAADDNATERQVSDNNLRTLIMHFAWLYYGAPARFTATYFWARSSRTAFLCLCSHWVCFFLFITDTLHFLYHWSGARDLVSLCDALSSRLV
jgi:hypothetical protein